MLFTNKEKIVISYVCGFILLGSFWILIKKHYYAQEILNVNNKIDKYEENTDSSNTIEIMETGKEEKNIEKNNKTNNKYSQSEKKQKKDIAIFKKININTGNLEELEKISYIGPSKARKIIEYRNANGNFKSLREIINVKGIGEKTFEKIKEQIEI